MQAIAALPLLGWLFVLSQRDGQFFGIGWIPETQWVDLPLTMINFTVGLSNRLTVMHWLALAVVIMMITRALLLRWSIPAAKVLISLWAFLPPLLIFLLSFRRPLYVDRFLIFCLPPILMLISQGMSNLERKLALAARLIMVALFLLGWYSLNLSPDRAIKENWREAIAYLDTHTGSDELVVQRILQIAVPMKYYSNGNLSVEALEINRQVDSLDELAAGYAGVWLIYWNASADTHSVAQKVEFDQLAESDPTAASWIMGDGPALSKRLDYPGVTIFHFTDFP